MAPIRMPSAPLRHGITQLRGLREDDIPSLAGAARDPEVVRWTRTPADYTEDDARMYILFRLDAMRSGESVSFAIVDDAAETQVLGVTSVLRISWTQRRAELGYWLAAGARGRGHATRSVGLLTEWAFAELGLERLELHIATRNHASQRVAERSGYVREAVLGSHIATPHGRLDVVIFGRLRTD